MNELKIFENQEFGQIRTIEEDGKISFCGSDVARSLGYDQPHKAIDRHCKGGGIFHTVIDNLGREQQAKFISEGDLYRLITNSKLPSAEKFETWVFDEVLPSIRKHGAYMVGSAIENLSPQLQLLINIELKQREQDKALEAVNSRIDGIKEIVSLDSKSWRQDAKKLIAQIAIARGGYGYFGDVQSEIYKNLDSRFGVSLEIRLMNKRRRMAEEGASKSTRDKLTKVDIIAEDKKLVEGYVAIIKEMAIKYGTADNKIAI